VCSGDSDSVTRISKELIKYTRAAQRELEQANFRHPRSIIVISTGTSPVRFLHPNRRNLQRVKLASGSDSKPCRSLGKLEMTGFGVDLVTKVHLRNALNEAPASKY